ncbi:hypothetical protein FQZ97_689350 [compost metagenome]
MCSPQVRVRAAAHGEAVGSSDHGVVVRGLAAITVAFGTAGAHLEADAVLFTEAEGHAQSSAAPVVGAVQFGGVLRGLQVNVASGLQADVLCLQLGTGGREIAFAGLDVDLGGLDGGAGLLGRGLALVLSGLAAADGGADADAGRAGVAGVGHRACAGGEIAERGASELVGVVPGLERGGGLQAFVVGVARGLHRVTQLGDEAADRAAELASNGEALALGVEFVLAAAVGRAQRDAVARDGHGVFGKQCATLRIHIAGAGALVLTVGARDHGEAAGVGAQQTLHCRLAGAGAVLRGLGLSESGEAPAGAGHEADAAGFGVSLVGAGQGVAGGFNVGIAPGNDGEVLVGDDDAGAHHGIATGLDGDVGSAHAAA